MKRGALNFNSTSGLFVLVFASAIIFWTLYSSIIIASSDSMNTQSKLMSTRIEISDIAISGTNLIVDLKNVYGYVPLTGLKVIIYYDDYSTDVFTIDNPPNTYESERYIYSEPDINDIDKVVSIGVIPFVDNIYGVEYSRKVNNP